MAEKKKKEKVGESLPKECTAAEFELLSDEEKLEAFRGLTEKNATIAALCKDLNEKNDELMQKAAGKVSDESYMRLAADFENFKRRNATAVSQSYAEGKTEVIKSFLEIEDNVERAIASISDENSRKGVELIKKQFDEILKKFNVVEIEAQNAPFDPNLHNAVMQCEAEREEDVDKCVEVFRKGYTMDGKVIRYSFVKVAK